MILDVTRAVADWCGNATYGVNARLLALDLDGTDTAPAALTILDETRHDDAAIRREDTTPVLAICAAAVNTLDGEAATYTHDADIPLELTIVRDATSPAAVVRDLYYTIRAVVQCLESLFGTSAPAATARSRNGVQLYAITSLAAAQVRPELTDTTGTATVMVTIRARDTLA